jgi:hypothetical protein
VWNGIREIKTPSNQPPEGYFKLPENFKMCSKDNMMSIAYYSEKEKDVCQREESGGFDDCVKQCLNEYAPDPEWPYFDVPDVNGNTAAAASSSSTAAATASAVTSAAASTAATAQSVVAAVAASSSITDDVPDVNGNTTPQSGPEFRRTEDDVPDDWSDDWSDDGGPSFRRNRRPRQFAAVETYTAGNNVQATSSNNQLTVTVNSDTGTVTTPDTDADTYTGAKPGSLDYEKHMDIYEYEDWKKRVLGGIDGSASGWGAIKNLPYEGSSRPPPMYDLVAGDFPAWTPINANTRFNSEHGIMGPPGDCIQTCKNNYYTKFWA